MVSQREKFSSSVANAIDSYFCGLAEAQAFCTCVSEERSGRLEVTDCVAAARKEPVFLVWLWSFVAVRYSWCSSDEVGQKRWFLLITFSVFLRSSAALWAARDDVPLADQRAVIMSCLALIGQGKLGLIRSQNRLCSNSFQIFSSSDYRIFVSSQLRILSTLFNTIIYLFIKMLVLFE